MIQISMYVEIDRYQIWFCWSKYWIYYKNLPEKPAENSQSHHCFPREMASDERAQKSILVTFHQPDLGSAFYWLKQISGTARAGHSLSV